MNCMSQTLDLMITTPLFPIKLVSNNLKGRKMLLNRKNDLNATKLNNQEELTPKQLSTVSAGHDGNSDLPYQLRCRDSKEELTENQLSTIVGGHDGMGNLPYQLLHPNADRLEVEDLKGRKPS